MWIIQPDGEGEGGAASGLKAWFLLVLKDSVDFLEYIYLYFYILYDTFRETWKAFLKKLSSFIAADFGGEWDKKICQSLYTASLENKWDLTTKD